MRRRTPKAIVPSEHAEQVVVAQWRDWQQSLTPALRWLHAIPNGGDRHPAVARKLKAEGVVSGVSDLLWIRQSRGYSGIALEMKKQDGRLKPDQKDYLEYVAGEGFFAVCAYSGDVAIELLRWYCQMRDDLPTGKYTIFNPTLCPYTENTDDGERATAEES